MFSLGRINPVFQVSGNSDNHDAACGAVPYLVPAVNVPDVTQTKA